MVIRMTEKIYEVWFDFFDGTQANNTGYQKRIKTFMSKEKAIAERDRLNEGRHEKSFYIKEVELDD